MKLEDLTVEELSGLLEELDAKRLEIKARGVEVMKVRAAKIAAGNAADRVAAKELADSIDWPAARAALQKVKLMPAEVGVQAKQ